MKQITNVVKFKQYLFSFVRACDRDVILMAAEHYAALLKISFF